VLCVRAVGTGVITGGNITGWYSVIISTADGDMRA